MKRCMVCVHTFKSGTVCPRCGTKKISIIPEFKGIDFNKCIRVLHEEPLLDEMLGLNAFKTSGGNWCVNVSTWVDGVDQYCVVSVPISVFRELVDKVDLEAARGN